MSAVFGHSNVLDAALPPSPQQPKTVEETGLSLSFLIRLVLKSMYLNGTDCASSLVEELKLSSSIVKSLVDRIRERQFIEPMASAANPDRPFDVHFTLSESGRARAVEAIEQSEYIGPAPVPLGAFEAQVLKQRLVREQLDREALTRGMSHLAMPKALVDRLGAALSSGQPILMYGPPGNGKSSISHAAARCFQELIFLPHCIEVDGQVIKVFDPTIHEEETLKLLQGDVASGYSVRHSAYDPRWVCCRRPFVSTGVELTLDMLDLNFHSRSHYYDAPLQMKASGGFLFVDDFGKQLARPIDILNRWIIPLEHGADYLTLETGRKFACPFDVMLVFSTNMPLEDVMDTDIIRRIPYRLRVEPPSNDEFLAILQREFAGRYIELPLDLQSYLIDELYVGEGRTFARYHPRFIVEHVIAHSKYNNCPPRPDRAILAEAMQDLFARE